jgi:hypothetical protein
VLSAVHQPFAVMVNNSYDAMDSVHLVFASSDIWGSKSEHQFVLSQLQKESSTTSPSRTRCAFVPNGVALLVLIFSYTGYGEPAGLSAR